MQQLIVFLVYFVSIFSKLLTFLIFARVVLSWIPTASNKLTEFIIYTTEPIMRPFRKYIPNIGPIDISPIVCLITVNFISRSVVIFLTNLV